MFKRWAFQRRWQRAHNVKVDPKTMPARLVALLTTFHPTLFDRYRPASAARVKVSVIQPNIEELVAVLDQCIDVVVEDVQIPASIRRLPDSSVTRNLDEYLVTQQHFGVAPQEAVAILLDRARRLNEHLTTLKQTDATRSLYCIRMFTHVFNDVLIVTEALRDVALKPNP